MTQDNQQSIRIVTASAADAPLLARLNDDVQQLHFEAEPTFFRMTDKAEVATSFAEMLGQENAKGFIAYLGGEAVGYALVFVRERPAHAFCFSRRWLVLDQLSVSPDHWGQGIGRALTDAVMAHARESAVDHVELETWYFNERAQRFFQSVGFRPRSHRYWQLIGPSSAS